MSARDAEWEQRHANFYNLPPFNAWREPEKWLAFRDGRIKSTAEKLEVPTDDRGFIKIDALLELVQTEVFRPDFQWDYRRGDPLTQPDDHHFYYDEELYLPHNHGGNTVPQRFRELPVHIGHMPRQYHNALHRILEPVPMPEMDAMADFIDSYDLAYNAFRKLFMTAKNTLRASQLFPARRSSIELGVISPRDATDAIGEAYMRDFFNRHFQSYSQAIELFNEVENKDIIYKGHETLKVTRPNVVVQKIGAVVSRKSVTINLNAPHDRVA